MARKGARKSHLGCFQCRRRHIKCNEDRPVCLQCSRTNRECRYGLGVAKRSDSGRLLVLDIAPAPAASAIQNQPEPSDASSSRYARGKVPSGAVVPIEDEHSVPTQPSVTRGRSTALTKEHPLTFLHKRPGDWQLNMNTLELLHNYHSMASKPFGITDVEIHTYSNFTVVRGIAFPPLMCQILAMSALEISLRRPERAQFYQTGAVALQVEALAGFNKIFAQIDEVNCVDIFIFQQLHAIQDFCDVFISSDDGFEIFLNRLSGNIRLWRGIPALASDWWKALYQTDLRLSLERLEPQHITMLPSRGECGPLNDLLKCAKASHCAVEIYCGAVRSMQVQFDRVNSIKNIGRGSGEVFVWLTTLQQGFVELIEQQLPEAMVILAYFAVLLDRCQKYWFIVDAPKQLLAHINRHLGKEWETWLAWPNAMLFGSAK